MSSQIAIKPRETFRAHPLFGWTLTPNARIRVRFRPEVVQNVDGQGHRHHPHAPDDSAGFRRLVTYGCSFTFGTGLADSETYPALLQAALPDLQVINKGVGGHGSVQALLRFRNDLNEGKVDAAVFGVISDHRYRNLPHPYRMKAHLSADWYRIGVEQVPHARLNRLGEIDIVFTPIWQPSLLRNDFEVFLPDEHVLDLVTIAVFREIRLLGARHGVPVLIALLDHIDPDFNRHMQAQLDGVNDVSTPHDPEHRFLPHDLHPNGQAGRLYADRLLAIIRDLFPQQGQN